MSASRLTKSDGYPVTYFKVGTFGVRKLEATRIIYYCYNCVGGLLITGDRF
jgi:hypothetical protein